MEAVNAAKYIVSKIFSAETAKVWEFGVGSGSAEELRSKQRNALKIKVENSFTLRS